MIYFTSCVFTMIKIYCIAHINAINSSKHSMLNLCKNKVSRLHYIVKKESAKGGIDGIILGVWRVRLTAFDLLSTNTTD